MSDAKMLHDKDLLELVDALEEAAHTTGFRDCCDEQGDDFQAACDAQRVARRNLLDFIFSLRHLPESRSPSEIDHRIELCMSGARPDYASRTDRWFAWFPVRTGALGTGRLCWLRWMERNRCMGVTIYWFSSGKERSNG